MEYSRLLGTLGLPANSVLSDKLVRDAYFRMAKQHHPDASKDQHSAAKFRAISHAYDMLKTEEKRQMLRLVVEDDDFGRKMRARDAASTPAYAANFRDVDEEFRNAEKAWKQTNRNTHRLMDGFEKFIHPRVLFFLLPLTVLGYVCVSSGIKQLLQQQQQQREGDGEAGAGGSERGASPSAASQVALTVEAWKNPQSGKWETSAPWSAEYRKAVAAGATKRMKREDVTPARREAP